ncbi:MAG TPA: RNA polymerase sigma factor [Vicinamibacterales bacterium]|nr:RNA polymerase sigma factor [Vicinamibacterales bacterium]
MADPFDPLKDGDARPQLAQAEELRRLMREYQAGRFEAFDELYVLLAPALRRYLLSHVRDAAKADDLVQDTFLQMHRARHTYDPALPLTPWATDDVTAMEIPVRGEASAYAEKTDVRRALGQVAANRRAAVIQHHVLGLSFKEIAERAGIAETAAKLRSSRGIAQLRALLRPGKADKS